MADLKINQYTYFAIRSEKLSCEEIEAKIGIRADRYEILNMKRREHDPTLPLINSWELICNDNIPIDEQIESLTKRLMPSSPSLQRLAATEAVTATLQVVRYLDDEDGESEIISRHGNLVKLSGQHQLLGWHINAETLAFLASIKAEVDVDEYN